MQSLQDVARLQGGLPADASAKCPAYEAWQAERGPLYVEAAR